MIKILDPLLLRRVKHLFTLEVLLVTLEVLLGEEGKEENLEEKIFKAILKMVDLESF